MAARSSGRTPASAPPYRPIGVRTPEMTTARATLFDELDADGLVVRADGLGAAQELLHGLAALVADVAGQVVHVHRDEPVGEGRVEAAAVAARVRDRLRPVV